jgi:hypothetical protein
MGAGMKLMKTTDGLDPIIFVIFGGAGDLAWRKLIPALFDLSQDRSQPAQFAIIAVDRIKLSDGALRNRWHDGVNRFSRFGKAKAAAWNLFAQHIHYQQGDFKQPSTYATLGGQCAKLEKQWGTKARRIFYMATPPSMFGEIPKCLGKAGLARDREWTRIVIEKPIGYDLESARALNAILAASFEEFRARARARESCIRGVRFCQPRDVAVTLPPFGVEPLTDCPVDFCLGCACVQQSCDIPAPLVNLLARGFDVGFPLTGADAWLILRSHGANSFQICSAYCAAVVLIRLSFNADSTSAVTRRLLPKWILIRFTHFPASFTH